MGTAVKSLLLIGPTGAGKTPLGDLIEKRGVHGRRCLHFDFGHQLRMAAGMEGPPEEFTREEHSFIRGVLLQGLLLENEHFLIAEKILHRFLRVNDFGPEDILLLNGLPRHTDQARDVDRIAEVKGLVILECTPEDVHGRILSNAGRDRTGRKDDGIGMIRKKLAIYRDRTTPLVEHYSNAGSKVARIRVTASSTAEELYSAFIPLSGNFLA